MLFDRSKSCWILALNNSDYLLYKPAASVRAQYNKEIFFDFSFGTYGLIINPYVPKEKSKNISFPDIVSFCFYTETAG